MNIPTQKILTVDDINNLPEGIQMLGFFPGHPEAHMYVLKRIAHHDRVSTYAIPHHDYKEQPALWPYEITGYGQHQLGNDAAHIRLWIPPEPVEPEDEGGDEVWATMLVW
jgi:hypothetical protein